MYSKRMCVILICLLSPVSTDVRYFVRKNVRIQQYNASSIATVGSRTECVASCSASIGCITASYSDNDGTCYLSSQETLHDGRAIPYPEYCEQISGWITASNINWPVVHLTWTATRYQLSFDGAKQVCQHYGTEIASPDDLLTARSMGFDFCACAWLSDGTQGFVLQAADSCWYRFDTGILRCRQTKADVWCKMPM